MTGEVYQRIASELIMVCETVWDEPPTIIVFKGHDGWPTYVPERMCCMEDRDQDGFEVPSGVCGDGFCSECWGIIAVEDKFCCHCGARIEAK